MALTSLLVCADAKAVQVLKQIFQDLSIQLEHCNDCSAATTHILAHNFDAVVVDAAYPESNQLIASARHSSTNHTALIIALVDVREQVRELFTHGVNFVLYKPVTSERAANSLRAAKSLMRREKRGKLRIRLHAQATIAYADADNVPATLVDLSEDGLAIQSERRLPQCCRIYFQFSLPGQKSVVRLSGEVVWQDTTGRVGIRFADVPQASRRCLIDWIKSRVAQYLPPQNPTSQARPTPMGLLDSPSNRRVQSRHACRLGADIFRKGNDVPYRCALTDISSGGCYVETTEPFPSGTSVEIVVRTPTMKVRVQGIVQAIHPGFGMGVKFTLRTMEQREQVNQLIACQVSEEDVRV
jgi:c-di-GMP-binding flagellar brake protein YcgR